MNTTAALLSGTDMFNEGGLIGSLMAFDFGKAVIDNEINLMLKRIKRGIEFDEENIALDIIKEIGPEGNYLTHPHTLEHMRDNDNLTTVAIRKMREAWEDEGRPDAHTRALKQVNMILSKDNPAVLSNEVDMKIRERFAGLVAGNVEWKGQVL
jgi:trimethylamine--corrinoid protein Co-methyltransferase